MTSSVLILIYRIIPRISPWAYILMAVFRRAYTEHGDTRLHGVYTGLGGRYKGADKFAGNGKKKGQIKLSASKIQISIRVLFMFSRYFGNDLCVMICCSILKILLGPK